MPVVQFEASSRFYHPAHSEEWSDPQLPARIEAMLSLLFKGLEAPRKRQSNLRREDIYIVSPRALAAALRIAEILAL